MRGSAWHDAIPGSLGLPLLGETLRFYRDPLGWIAHHHQVYGPVFKSHILGEVTIGLLGADANRFVLVERARSFSSWGGWRHTIGDLFHGGLMLKDGADHARHRAIMQAAFRPAALSGYLEGMRPVVARHLEAWGSRREVAIYPAAKELTLDIAGRVFLGLELEREIDRVNRAFLDLVGGSIAFVRRAFPGLAWSRALRARRDLAGFFGSIVEARRADPGTNLLGRLIAARSETGESLTNEEIVDHMVFLLMAAHDTTTSTLTALFHQLAIHPEWRTRLRDESAGLARSGPLSFESMARLDGIDRAAKEALRLHPPLVFIPRRATEPITFHGFDLPAGAFVAVSPGHTHRMAEYWTRPDEFDPDRFAEGRAEHRRTPGAYFPFGAGAHSCLGQIFAELEVKSLVHEALARFDWSLRPGHVPRWRQVPLQSPRGGLPVVLSPIGGWARAARR